MSIRQFQLQCVGKTILTIELRVDLNGVGACCQCQIAYDDLDRGVIHEIDISAEVDRLPANEHSRHAAGIQKLADDRELTSILLGRSRIEVRQLRRRDRPC